MTVEPLEQLRAADPVPHGSSAPPVEWVLARIESTPARPGRRRRSWGGAFVPAVAVAATLIVVAVVLVAVTHRHRQAPAHVPPATRTAPAVGSVPSPSSLMPRGGMRGALSISGAASGSAADVLISFSQCQPCHAHGAGTRSDTHLWQAATSDGGGSWHVAAASADLAMFDLAGVNGWAEGVGPDRVARFFASHDGGRTWHVASSTDSAPGGVGDVTIAGGEVWSLGSHCDTHCAGSTPPGPPTDVVLRAPAPSSRLSETEGQPPLGDTTNVSVVATARDDAYVLTDDYGTNPTVAEIVRTRLFATHDGGRTWRRMPAACPTHTFGRLYAGGIALWATCDPMRGGPIELRRSADSGEHWTTLASKPDQLQLQPASAEVAWALTPAGKVLRTSDGGRTWARAWYAGRPEPAVVAGTMPPGLSRAWDVVLTVQGPTTATVIAVVTRGRVDGHAKRTDFVTYRTTDGGRTWRPSVVLLPDG
jgi:hypothetical protein